MRLIRVNEEGATMGMMNFPTISRKLNYILQLESHILSIRIQRRREKMGRSTWKLTCLKGCFDEHVGPTVTVQEPRGRVLLGCVIPV